MTTNTSIEKEKSKLIHEKCQQLLASLLRDEDNKYCVDCDGKSPRWASWNLGLFLCIRCAGIHRNLGVHISKVKSVNLDSWTPQQVACIEEMGNSRARAVYEANLPDNFKRPQNDSSLEKFIRAKYEAKKYIAKEWVQPPMPHPTWDIIIEKQLTKKMDKKASIGKINFPITKMSLSKSKSISPKPLPRAPSSKSIPNQIQKVGKLKLENGEIKTSPLQDLLGLTIENSTIDANKSMDPFGDFLSAPMPAKLEVTDLKTNEDQLSEELSFFNQKQPEALVAEKMSKDSILALYAKIPNQNNVTFGGMQGVNSSLSQSTQHMQQGLANYQQNNFMMFPQTPPVNAIVPGMVPSLLLHQGSVSSPPTPHMVPVVPVGFQLSAANPFAQMQSQMTNMNMTRVSPRPQNINAQSLQYPPVYNYLPEQKSSLAANLWQ